MFTEYMYYDLQIEEVEIKESLRGTPYIQIKWRDINNSENCVWDNIVNTNNFSANRKLNYYSIPYWLDRPIEKSDLEYLIGWKDNLKVIFDRFKNRKFAKVITT